MVKSLKEFFFSLMVEMSRILDKPFIYLNIISEVGEEIKVSLTYFCVQVLSTEKQISVNLNFIKVSLEQHYAELFILSTLKGKCHNFLMFTFFILMFSLLRYGISDGQPKFYCQLLSFKFFLCKHSLCHVSLML